MHTHNEFTRSLFELFDTSALYFVLPPCSRSYLHFHPFVYFFFGDVQRWRRRLIKRRRRRQLPFRKSGTLLSGNGTKITMTKSIKQTTPRTPNLFTVIATFFQLCFFLQLKVFDFNNLLINIVSFNTVFFVRSHAILPCIF